MVDTSMVEDGLDTEQHPDTGLYRWLWTTPNGGMCIGLFTHKTEAAALKAGKTWAISKLKEIEDLQGDG